MDFQSDQEQAQQNTAGLIGLLALGILSIILVVAALLVGVFYYGSGDFQPVTAFAVAAPLTTLGVLGASMVKSSQIRSGGGSYVAASLGGRQVDFNTHEADERQLTNVVEEIAIASGVPVPAVFVLDNEPGINAFAAGWAADTAAIGVTRGALNHLNRRELQGVIAHEFSHIRNGDTRVKTRIIGWVFGIAVITVVGRLLLQHLWWAPRRRGSKDNTALLMIAAGLGLVVIGWIGTLFARMIQAAVSRQREFLADASAVQYTRDPSGIGEALVKIGASGKDNSVRSAHATEASHLFFSSPFAASFATHPPLKERILRLMPEWDGTFGPSPVDGRRNGSTISRQASRRRTSTPSPGEEFGHVGFAEGTSPPKAQSSFEQPSLEGPRDAHIEQSRSLINQIPKGTLDQLRTRRGAVAAIVGSLASTDPEVRSREAHTVGPRLRLEPAYIEAASDLISRLDRPLQLPAIDIALRSIQQTPPEYKVAVSHAIQDLGASHAHRDLFHWVLQRVVLRHLEDQHDDGSNKHNVPMSELTDNAATVYAVLAWNNSSGESEAQRSFEAALKAIDVDPFALPPNAQQTFVEVDTALERLSHLDNPGRQQFVIGATAAVLLDRITTAAEAELVRVVADAVRLPVPPLLPASDQARSRRMKPTRKASAAAEPPTTKVRNAEGTRASPTM